VGRAPSPAAGPLTGLVCIKQAIQRTANQADGGVGRGSGDPPHKTHFGASAARCASRLQASSAAVGSIAVLPTSTNAIFPSISTTYVTRFAIPSGRNTPYAFAVDRSLKSLSRGKERFSCLAKTPWEGLLSVLMPNTFVSLPSNFAIPAWYAVNSFVQPPVNAAGKNASTTGFLPLKSARVILPPMVPVSVKFGATSPTLSGTASPGC